MTEAVEHMVQRFLTWKLPENFNPDAGISFKPTFNDHLPVPMRHNPTGTNLFDYVQAKAMVMHMLEGAPSDQGGWIVGNGDGTKWRTWGDTQAEAVTAWNTRAPDPRITELEQPYEPGAFAGDIWYGHPEKRTLGTHRWDGSAWQELPSEIEGCLSLLADARARIAALTAEVARKDEALRRLAYWFDTDADYLETLSEAECADNNRMLSIARAALEARND